MRVDLLPFLALSVLLILVPGPDTAVVTKNALSGGRPAALSTAGGIVLGLVVWTLAAALGVAALLRASAVAFDVLKLVGAAYLVWVGVGLLRRSTATRAATAPAVRRRRAFRQGLLTNLANPKIAVFFTSFLPQFVPARAAAFPSLLLLGALYVLISVVWLGLYGSAVAGGVQLLRRPRVQRALDRCTGVVFVAFGVRLALEHR